jgi:Zn-finger nucleic acid-binding protein
MSEEPDLKITAQCPDCKINVVADDESDETSVVYCAKCKEKFGTSGEVKAKMQKAGVDHLKGQLNDALKGIKGWTVKGR